MPIPTSTLPHTPHRSAPRPRVGVWLAALCCTGGVWLGGCGTIGGSRTADAPSRGTPRATTLEQATPQTQAQIQTAQTLLDEGRLDAALAEFGLALEENPNLVEAHMGMGQVFRERNQPAIAEEYFANALRLDPNNADAQYYVGLMSQLQGRINEAITAYLRTLVLDPDDPRASREIASAYVQAGRPDYALPYALRATRLEGDNQAAWCNLAATYNLLGDYEKALQSYRTATELGTLDDPVLLGLADTHLKLGNYQRAANTLESVIRTNPTATAHERLGYARFKRREFDNALNHYRTAVEMNPREVAALNGVGAVLVTYYMQGDGRDRDQLEDALAAWRTSLRIRPSQPRIVNLLARYQRPG